MTETKAKTEVLIAQHRRARLAVRAGTTNMKEFDHDAAFDRLQMKVAEADSVGHGQLTAGEPNAEQRLAALEKSDQVDRLLADLKTRANGG
jgi:phage shock protein A